MPKSQACWYGSQSTYSTVVTALRHTNDSMNEGGDMNTKKNREEKNQTSVRPPPLLLHLSVPLENNNTEMEIKFVRVSVSVCVCGRARVCVCVLRVCV